MCSRQAGGAPGGSPGASQPAAVAAARQAKINAENTLARAEAREGPVIAITYGLRNVRFMSVARCTLLSITVSCPALSLPR